MLNPILRTSTCIRLLTHRIVTTRQKPRANLVSQFGLIRRAGLLTDEDQLPGSRCCWGNLVLRTFHVPAAHQVTHTAFGHAHFTRHRALVPVVAFQ